jgi:copper chaperone
MVVPTPDDEPRERFMSATTSFTVEGMTCEHCVAAVTEELQAITAVRSADVQLSDGSVRLDLDGPVTDEELAAAIDEAGYRIVPS